ncbi:hypothetical protein LSH36_512g03068 [Paralvinella palmiformis]|uniref:Secreted protein n=1 Tax=Paralvinella palmiformis TaxID=53620 RepID=A0AAD9J8Z7_9ANNE|nr:hypothetical protein LSH36_512g03068 [Paralvinella palmiformis]
MKTNANLAGWLGISACLLCLRTSLEDFFVASEVIWRCPDFNLLHCKQIPSNCASFRMIYIRHGDLECPGCLICADRSKVDGYKSPPIENEVVPMLNLKREKKRKMKERERRRRQRKKLKLRRKKRRERKERKRRRKKLKKLERALRKSNAIITNT